MKGRRKERCSTQTGIHAAASLFSTIRLDFVDTVWHNEGMMKDTENVKWLSRIESNIFPGHNLMTPDIHAYYRITRKTYVPQLAYAELSSGRSFFSGKTIWGVTVRNHKGERLDPDPSTIFESRKKAEEFILQLPDVNC